MYLGGYWGAPERCWIRKRASQGADLERDKDKVVQAKEKTSPGGKARRERWWLSGTKCCVPGSVLCTLYVLTNSIL